MLPRQIGMYITSVELWFWFILSNLLRKIWFTKNLRHFDDYALTVELIFGIRYVNLKLQWTEWRITYTWH